MGTPEDGDVLLSSVPDRLTTPFNNQTFENFSDDISFFNDDFSLTSDVQRVAENDQSRASLTLILKTFQLTLLMKDVDFNFDLLDQNDNSKLLGNGMKCGDDICFPSSKNCYSHYSPNSSDSGNHSPSSTSSEGAQFSELWNSAGENVGDRIFGEELPQISEHVDRKHEDPSVLNSTFSLCEKNENFNNACALNGYPLEPKNISVQPSNHQSVVYIVSSASPNLFNKPSICPNSVPVQNLVEKTIVPIRPTTLKSSNRMQPYTTSRPQLLIPKSDPEAFATNPLINTVSMGTPATIITPVITSSLGVHAKNSLNQIFLPVSSRSSINSEGFSKKQSEDAMEYARKREERKIKNRASAQQSRLRKRHELDELKQKLNESEKTVDKLRKENEQLRKQISSLQGENEFLKKNLVGVRGRAGVVTGVACFLFFCAFASFGQRPVTNLETLIRTSDNNPSGVSGYSADRNTFHGRSLSFVQYDNAKGERREKRFSESVVSPTSDSDVEEIQLFGRNVSNDIDCGDEHKLILNQTERIKHFFRVNNDLSSWVDRHERLLFLQMRRVFRAPVPKLSKSVNHSVSYANRLVPKLSKIRSTHKLRRNTITKKEERILKLIRERAWRHIDLISSGGTGRTKAHNSEIERIGHLLTNSRNQLPLDAIEKERLHFPNAETHYMELARAIKQKNDTLYVVALQASNFLKFILRLLCSHNDYYLLPTVDRKSTDRPRVSLILPAFSYNGTIRNQVSMMRIECEVTGTSLFHISDSLLMFFYNQSHYH
uniref:BZIP domain-containing protein n=1 Tax=Syphacia muris TaxID=451379 RepID=A0A158R4T7_9BILA